MIGKNLLFLICISYCSVSFAQSKQLWAKSYLDQKAPELNITQWVNEQPNTEGKFILIDFWGTWCGPCIKGIPDMNAYQKEFINQLVVIGISKESFAKVKAFKKANIQYANGIDVNGALNNAFEIQGIPHVVLIDPKGIVRWEGFPFLKGHELTSEVIQDLITKYK
ncbi:MAG: TlpA family protein disulfide reductase [Aquaticitalea sp.]